MKSAFVILAVLAAVLILTLARHRETAERQEPPVERRALPVSSGPVVGSAATLAEYNRIRVGMSYDEVREIIGAQGTEMSRNPIGGIATVMYSWRGAGIAGANMNAVFQDGKLVDKAQFGLR